MRPRDRGCKDSLSHLKIPLQILELGSRNGRFFQARLFSKVTGVQSFVLRLNTRPLCLAFHQFCQQGRSVSELRNIQAFCFERRQSRECACHAQCGALCIRVSGFGATQFWVAGSVAGPRLSELCSLDCGVLDQGEVLMIGIEIQSAGGIGCREAHTGLQRLNISCFFFELCTQFDQFGVAVVVFFDLCIELIARQKPSLIAQITHRFARGQDRVAIFLNRSDRAFFADHLVIVA